MRNLGNFLRPLALAGLLAFTACSKIYFHNGESGGSDGLSEARFHHIGVLGLVEFSPPVDLKALCSDKEWATVKTMNTFVTGLVGGLTYNMYAPWAYAYVCK